MSDYYVNFRGHEVKVADFDYSPGCAPKTSGPPENCYPGESAEVSYTVDSGNELLDDILTTDLDEEFQDAAMETVEQDAEKARNDAAISRYQDRMNNYEFSTNKNRAKRVWW